MTSVRINKYLSQLGLASRRQVDQLISQRRILINKKFAVLGDKVDPEVDEVVVDKKIIPPHPQQLVYYLLHKPKFYLSTTVDTHGRKTVLDLVPTSPRVYPVGRLDFESTGLIILTNDGDLSLRLTHPRYHLPKTYLVTVLGKVTLDTINHLTRGVELEDGLTAPLKVKTISQNFGRTTLEMILYQGKKRQIRRMCSELHLHVLELHRLSIGSVTLGQLPSGKYRPLTPEEVNLLRS